MYCRLRDLREDHDMKQKDLAAYLNCSQQVYSNDEMEHADDTIKMLNPEQDDQKT